MTIVRQPIPLADLDAMAKAQFGDLVKAVVDVERGLMAIGDPEKRKAILAVVSRLVAR